MPEESLRRFLERLNSDTAFVERLKANPGEALEGYEFSPTEQVALATNDEDGLRRLTGMDTAGFAAGAAGLPGGLALPATLFACILDPSSPSGRSPFQTNHDVSECHRLNA